jgi:hypothetical protein
MITETIARKASLAIDRRMRAAKFVRSALNHVFPDHWSFMLGEIALYSFMVLVVTGTYLALFFHASSEKVIYHGSYAPLDGQKVPLGDSGAHGTHLSNGRLSQAARDELADRADAARTCAGKRVLRLLDAR